MQRKLTLRLDEALIEAAKRASRKSGKSISRMVADYFFLLDRSLHQNFGPITPRARSLYGLLASSNVSEEDYLLHLEAKHQ